MLLSKIPFKVYTAQGCFFKVSTVTRWNLTKAKNKFREKSQKFIRKFRLTQCLSKLEFYWYLKWPCHSEIKTNVPNSGNGISYGVFVVFIYKPRCWSEVSLGL